MSNEARFDALVREVCSAADFESAWRIYDDTGFSADGIVSAVWDSRTPVPRELAELAGCPHCVTRGELAQSLKDWGRPDSDMDRYVPKVS
jgi:hypothetical protein